MAEPKVKKRGDIASIVVYLDDHGEPVDEKMATQVRVLEYNKRGHLVRVEHGVLNQRTER